MASNSRESLLVIRAKNEASKVVETVADALKVLGAAQNDVAAGSGKVSSNLSGLKNAITAVQSAYGKIDKEANSASDAFDRQQASLVSTKEQYAAVVAQINSAKEALGRLRGQKAPEFVGPVNVPLIKAAETAYRDLLSQQSRLTSDIGRQEAAVNTSRTALQQLGSTAIAAEQALAGVGTEEQRAAILAQGAAFERAERQAEQYRQEISRLASAEGARQNDKTFGITARPSKSARDSAAVFEEAAAAENQMAAAAADLKARLDPLAAVQDRLNAELLEARGLYAAGKITATELAGAEKLLAINADQAARSMGRQSSGKGTFLGLRPYELTNLSYQINDVFTQLASGTSLTQTLAQQGGQFVQIFGRQIQNLLPLIGRMVPLIGAVVTVILTLRAAMKQVGDEVASQRLFGAVLKASADGLDYQKAALAGAAHELDQYSGSLKDARAAVDIFIKDGIGQEQIERFGMAAQNLAKIFKLEIPDAAKQTSAAFSAGYDAIKKLDDGFNFLTAAEREHIKALFDSGRASEARTQAFDIFNAKMEAGAANMRGPWAEAMHSLSNAWQGFLGWLADTPLIQGAIALLGDLAKAAEDLASRLPGAQDRAAGGAGTPAPQVVRLEERLTALRKERATAAAREAEANERLRKPGLLTGTQPYRLRGNAEDRARALPQDAPRANVPVARDTAKIDAEIKTLTAQIAMIKTSLADTINPNSEAAKKARQETLDQIKRERESLGDLTDAQKVRKAGEEAYQNTIRTTGDIVVAQAQKAIAIQKEQDRQRKALDYGRLATKIGGAESSGDALAKNPQSTATGLGQFIEGTWLRLFKAHFPTQAAAMSEKQILELRKDSDISKKMIEIYARENAEVLQRAGKSVTEANLYLAHFLGASDAKKILSVPRSTPTSAVLGADKIEANKSVLKGKTAGDVIAYTERKVGQSDGDRAAMEADAAIQEKLNKDAAEFQRNLDNRIKGWTDEAAALKALADQEKLTIEAKYAANRAAEISKEINRAEVEAQEKNQVLSTERRDQIEKTVGALYDLQHAEAMHNEVLKQKREYIQDTIGLEQQRQALIKSLQYALSQGDDTEAAALREQIELLRLKLLETLPVALELAKTLGDEKSVANLEKVNLTMKTITGEITNAAQINGMIADGLVNAWNKAADAIGKGENAIDAMADAFRTFAADFLRQIANMILKQLILSLIQKAFGGPAGTIGGGGIGGIIAGAVNATVGGGTKHRGGLAGSGPTRMMPAEWFANAPRLHSGGMPGLAPGEIPTILKTNEEVLTASDPRHVANGGKGGGAAQNIKIVNTINAGEFVSEGASTAVGEKAILNVIQNNASAVRNALGVAG